MDETLPGPFAVVMGSTLWSMSVRRTPSFYRLVVGALFALLLLAVGPIPDAAAHAELLQSSPEHGDTVGGTLDTVSLQFFDLDLDQPQNARLFDADNTEVLTELALDGDKQQIVLSLLDPIQTPGEYTVIYAVIGLDGDFSQEAFTFAWAQGAPEQKGITLSLGDDGFDVLTFGLLLAGAAIAAFLVQRVLTAYKEHRAAQLIAATEPG